MKITMLLHTKEVADAMEAALTRAGLIFVRTGADTYECTFIPEHLKTRNLVDITLRQPL